MEEYLNNVFSGSGSFVEVAIIIVAALIAIMAMVSVVTSIYLMIKYVKFNRTKNSKGFTGVDVARKILDNNGLNHIKVSVTGSVIFGNSYSHYFKKVRLRRFTRNKQSVTALGMGSQKACLAILDKEGDPDMKRRIRLVPLITFGPFAFIPLIIIGVLLDVFLFGATGVMTVVLALVGLAFYIFAFILSFTTLKTEVKAQKKACEILARDDLATSEEIEMLKELFRLYNIQYVNDMIIAMLEILMYILRTIAAFQGNSSSGSND